MGKAACSQSAQAGRGQDPGIQSILAANLRCDVIGLPPFLKRWMLTRGCLVVSPTPTAFPRYSLSLESHAELQRAHAGELPLLEIS